MDKTQQHRLTLKFIEEMSLDIHSATLVDLIANAKNSADPAGDLRKAGFYLLRLLEKVEIDSVDVQNEVTNPSCSPTGTKVLRLYDNDRY